MGYLQEIEKLDIPGFLEMAGGQQALTTRDKLTTMQLNIGRACNLACAHCHVEAGPDRTECMGKDVMEASVEVFRKHGFSVADITGGAPEMNPHLEWLIEAMAPLAKKVLVRSNLVILEDDRYAHFLDVYKRNKVELICSMPCYGREGVEAQRGRGTYDPIIRMLKRLNDMGYGIDPELRLNLAFNPGGPSLPPVQSNLEKTYKESLQAEHGIVFNDLYTLTNSPLGRFGKRLVTKGELADYMNLLTSTFNEETVSHLMCLDQLSVGWDGKLYDCDSNQAIGLPIDAWDSIFDLVDAPLELRVVKTSFACFSCTAGCGSSCGGSLADAGADVSAGAANIDADAGIAGACSCS